MMNGLDYSQGIPDIAAMKQGNVAFVCRYVGWSDTSQTKILTSAEAQTLSQNGIAIVSNYEWYGSRPSEGAAAADVDAARALQIHKNCGGPDTAPIYFSVDYDSPGSDVAEYFKELGNKIGIQRVGAYGGYRCIKYLFDNGLITWGWQTYAWSGGQWDSRAQIRQTQNSIQFGGIEVDFNTGMVDNVGQWKVGGTQVTTPKVVLNAQGGVCETPWWYQLAENEMMTCGPTTCAMVHFSVQPGGQLTATSETIDQETDAIIKDVFGISDPKQFGGVDSWTHDMYNILVYLRDKYHKIHFLEVSTMEDLERGVRAGYPCIFGCNEADITAWNKGNNRWEHAYTWSLSAGHIPGVLVGIEAGTGNWLVVDPLNNRFQGYGPPYIYKRSDIARSFTGGAIIQLTDWLQPIPPLNQWPAGFNAQNFTGGGNMPIPTGWKDDGSTLTAPNNVSVRTGFRSKVIAGGWDANNYPVKGEFARNPVEPSNTALGPGTWQNFRFGALAYTVQRGVYVPFSGEVLQWYMDNFDSVQKERDALKKQVADLQAQLTAASGGTAIPQVVKDDIISLASLVTPASSLLDKLVKDAGL